MPPIIIYCSLIIAFYIKFRITIPRYIRKQYRIISTVDIRADAVVLLGQRVGGGPAGYGRVVHPGGEVEERDARAEERLILLAGEVPAVRGDHCMCGSTGLVNH
mgnify:CR=1 FL=1